MKRLLPVWVLLALLAATPGSTRGNMPDSMGGALADAFVLADIGTGELEVRLWERDGESSAIVGAQARGAIVHPDGSVQQVGPVPVESPVNADYRVVRVKADSPRAWSPTTPSLCHLGLAFTDDGGTTVATFEQRFGMRKIEVRGPRLFVNNKPFFGRFFAGEGGCGCDKLTRDQVRKRLQVAREFGFNAVRHHTHVPSDEYMQVADEVGLFVQMEIGARGVREGPGSERFTTAKEAWTTMIQMARRHPSSFIYCVGNEIYGNDPELVECLDKLHDMSKAMDPSTLYLNRAGSNPFNDAHGKSDLIERPIGEYEHTAEFARETFELYLRGNRKGRSGEVPIIAHEYPLVASYPNPALAGKYDTTPEWIRITVEKAQENGLEYLLPIFVKNTERIQAVCRKEMLEEARKFPELDGYSMLRFTDCGAYVSGVVDDLADPKNVTREEFLRTNGETALVCTWNQRSFVYGEKLVADIDISHHGGEPFDVSECRWWLMNSASVLASGKFGNIRVGPVNVARVGRVEVVVPALSAPAKLTLRAELPDTRPLIDNEWNAWAFPAAPAAPAVRTQATLWDPRGRLGVFPKAYPNLKHEKSKNWSPGAKDRFVITDSWQEGFYDFLGKGGRIWVISDKTWPWPEEIGIFGLHITNIIPEQQAPAVFPELDEKLTNWLTICSNNPKREGNSGTVVYPHPALGDFPHEGFCDLQFWPMIYRAKSLRLADFPAGTEPAIRTIDNFSRGRSKGYTAELRVGEGRLFISTLNLTQSYSWSPATRYMFDCLLEYTAGDGFQPSTRTTPAESRAMITAFAEEQKKNPPAPLNEMAARYDTAWRQRLQPGELVILPVHGAKGIDGARIGTHFEYAQTQFYFAAKPGESLSWEFETKAAGEFTCVLFLATPLKGVPIRVKLDAGAAVEHGFAGSGSWGRFVQTDIPLSVLAPGKHTLTLDIAKDAPSSEGTTVYLRDIELRGKAAGAEKQAPHL